MKLFTKEQIEATRRIFIEYFEERKTKVKGLDFAYFVIPQSLQPDLPNFVMRMTGTPEDGALFAVSDTILPEVRDYPVFHEVIEFMDSGKEEGKCQRSLKQELNVVPDHLLRQYVKDRKTFFSKLIGFAQGEKQREHYTSGDLDEFRGSLNYLRKLRF